MTEIGNKRNSTVFRYVLIGFLIVLGLIIFKYARPYLSGFLGAATLYALFNGQMTYFTEKLKWNKSFSAFIILFEAIFFFLGPLTGISLLIIDTFSGITIDPEVIRVQIEDFVAMLEERLGFDIFTPENLSFIPKLGTNLLQTVGMGAYSFVINIIVILFLLYYMLCNRKEFQKAIKEIMPLKEENKQILAEETKLIIKANAIGIPLLAIIQGAFAYGGYVLFGVDNAVLYAILTGFASIIPILGTTLVWAPLGLSLLLSGDMVNGIGLLVYGFLIIGGVDNVARFMLQKVLADIHPLITVFGVMMGIPMFGFWGVIFGPLLLSLFVLFFNMYRHEYVLGSTAQPRVTTRMKAHPILPGYNSKKTKAKKVRKRVEKEIVKETQNDADLTIANVEPKQKKVTPNIDEIGNNKKK